MPTLMKLKDTIYSSEYRAFMERISGLQPGTLTAMVDCAANCHTKGCHLLCHDDVIGTRKVSYIIYLTDTLPIWTDEDGGRLEL
jgi:Rps23 Pro-64 3,4-dihydroxylase Tpa1-like proline 4-hydroxylase